ncbi:MAG: hypothetical protein K6G05_01895 [Lachnospiraceae bacterium]|nr:hypothetical protein [Lachnospiraceae bacterium]
MSHDIRTPMNAIIGMDEMILRSSQDEEILTYAEKIKTAGNTLLGIIKVLLFDIGFYQIAFFIYDFINII